MPGKRKETMDIREMLRHLRRGQSNRTVAKTMGMDRKTVARYRTWATEQGLLGGALPPLGDLHRLFGSVRSEVQILSPRLSASKDRKGRHLPLRSLLALSPNRQAREFSASQADSYQRSSHPTRCRLATPHAGTQGPVSAADLLGDLRMAGILDKAKAKGARFG